MTDDVAKIAAGLTKAQQRALLRANAFTLRQDQSDRGALTGPLTDYSFRPALLTSRGLAVRAHLLGQAR